MNSKQINNPLVSIVIATFNRADLLPETLDSIIQQKHTNWECLIIDDGSTDNTVDVIQKYVEKDSRFKFFPRPDKYQKGPGGAFNYGLDLSKGEFILWFGSDDLMHPEMLKEKVKFFVENQNIQSVFSHLYFFEKINEITGQTRIRKPFDDFYENIITWRIPAWSVSLMFRNQFLKRINERFDESLKRLLDYDYHTRIYIKYPHEVYLIDKPLCYVRRNNDSITTYFYSREKIIELEKSEFIVANKIIRLLIRESKFTNNLEKFFYRDHKRRITNLVKASDREVTESFKQLIEYYLEHNHKYFKRIRFRTGLFLLKTFRINNLFLIYQQPFFIRFIRKNINRLYKILFVKGYLKKVTTKQYRINRTSVPHN